MADEQELRRTARDAQAKFERDLEATQNARGKAFAKVHREGLSLRQIAAEVGLHHTRVHQIIRDA
jgi:DNA-directed RNA polymerase specialized sigma24 family protein